jgi:transcription termination factor Rho
MHRRDPGQGRDGGNNRDRNGDAPIDRELLAELEREEPLSLAEELDKAAERVRRVGAAIARDDARDRNVHIAELQRLAMPELIAVAEAENVAEIAGLKKQELIFRILKERVKLKGMMFGEGTLEILPDGFGFLRSPDYHYLSCPDDIYVSPSQIRRFNLRNGNTVTGTIRPPKENERYFALLRVEGINGDDPNLLAKKIYFDDLTPEHPDKRIVMEIMTEDVETRVVDMIVPIGFGQRGLIVSPPRAGKTILMQKMAKAVLTNYPDAYVIMLLIDERPEEVTDMERQIKGRNCEVISSTFDETSARHVQVSEMVIEKAKRMVEYGRDVIIFLDSITRLARAWNAECPHSGKILSGGIDANAMQRPKKFFGSARKIQEGGSLTIIATALVDTGSRMDEVIFEEFKGTGNQEIVLDRRLVDRRVWPAIDIGRSGTRREEMLMDPEEHRRVCLLRRVLNEMNAPDAMELLVNRLVKTKTNAEFLMSMKE